MAKKSSNGTTATLERIELVRRSIPLHQIQDSPFQRRTKMDEKRLAELAAAYRRGDPIPLPLARPLQGELVELVYGHRRLRAAELAELAELEVNVAELTDSQARHFQWEENAGREDLHPLDEADLFRDWNKTESPEEIAARIVRDVRFVRARIKLAALCEKGREAFLAGHLGTGQAQLVAGLPEEQQGPALERALQVDWQGSRPTVAQLSRWLEQGSLDLGAAPWKADDEALVPEVGSCAACPKRTGATQDLFAGVKGDRCLDRACWDRKLTASLDQGKVLRVTMKTPGVWIEGTQETFETARRGLQEEVDLDAKEGVGQARTVTDEEVRETLDPEQLECERMQPAVNDHGTLGRACLSETCAVHGAAVAQDRQRAERDAKVAQESAPAEASRQDRAEKARKEKEQRELQVRIATLNAVVEKLPLPGGKLRKAELQLITAHFALPSGRLLARHKDLQGEARKVAAGLSEERCYRLLFEAVFMSDLNTWGQGSLLLETAKALKVDVEKIRQGFATAGKKTKEKKAKKPAAKKKKAKKR